MAEQEQEHLDTFDDMLREYRTRPTVLQPIWNICGYALGYGTGLLGKEVIPLSFFLSLHPG